MLILVLNWAIGLMSRVFANGPGDRGSIPGWLKKMVLDTALLNTQHNKVRIKDKVELSRKWSSAPTHLSVVAIEKGAFGSPSTKVANFTYSQSWEIALISLRKPSKWNANSLVQDLSLGCWVHFLILITWDHVP